MKILQHDEALHGVGATLAVTFAGLEEFGLKLATSVVVAIISTGASLLVKWLIKRLTKAKVES
jgi:Na+-translocating ferredoxin:NAD+ oxidoreductase RnfE subunit